MRVDWRLERRVGPVFLAGFLAWGAVQSCLPNPPVLSADERLLALLAPVEEKLAGRRYLEPRLARFPCRPCTEHPLTLGIELRCPRAELAAARQILWASRVGTAAPAEQDYLKAIARLTGGAERDLDEALVDLESSCRAAPESAQRWSDLAAAYLLRGKARDWPQDFWEAAQAAKRAVTLAPTAAAAWHNLALANERLLLRKAAITAWRRALVLEPNSDWTDEIAAHLRALTLDVDLDQRQDWMRSRIVAGDGTALRESFETNPQLPRDLALSVLLPDWTNAHLQARVQDAERLAVLLEKIGEASRAKGEPFFAAVAAGLRGKEAARLARAMHEFFAVRQGIEKDRSSCSRLPDLEKRLRALGSPLALEARRYQCSCTFYSLRYSDAAKEARAFAEQARLAGYPTLQAKALWIVGSAMDFQGEIEAARKAFEEAESRFRQAGERGNQASMMGQFATLAWESGEVSRSFRERYSAIEGGLSARDGRIAVLYTNGAIELSRRNPALALAMIEEAEALQSPDNLVGNFDTAIMGGRLRLRLGDRRAAVADLAAGSNILKGVADPKIRRALEISQFAFRAELALESTPRRSIRDAERALAICLAGEDLVKVPDILEIKARAERAIGDLDAAHTSISQALTAFENLASRTGKIADRVRLFDRAEELMEMAIEVDLKRNDPSAALDDLERFRSRFLLEQLGGRPLEGTQLAGTLGSDETLLIYLPLADSIKVWHVDSTGTDFRTLATSRERIEKWLADWLGNILAGKRIGDEDARLFDALIRPLGPLEGKTLSIVASGALARAPFAALYDRTSGRFLIEDFSLVRVPSGSVRKRLLELTVSGEPSPNGKSALVVGDPSFPAATAPNLRRLEHAREEAAAIAESWPGSTHLETENATAAAFLAAAGQHRIVHFSGHALVDWANPFAASLLFAPDKDHPGGELGALEIYERKFPQTRLAVLAACATGTGYASPIEGTLDLSHPFLAAGVPRVVTTLWEIRDRTDTSDFLRTFYSALRQNDNAADALRSAQVQFLRSKKTAYRDPRLWAGFQVVGVEASTPGGVQ